MRTLLKQGTIVTANSRQEIFVQGDVVIEDDRIRTVSPDGATVVDGVDAVIDCRGKIIIPGLVSAHTHLPGLIQRGLWDEPSFESWSLKSAATEKYLQLSPEDIYVIHTAACIELIRNGVTTVLNMFTVPVENSLDCIASACRAF